MIFICVGSREYQFDRLIEHVDVLSAKGAIEDTVYAQIGCSSYIPVNFKYKRFISTEEYINCLSDADLIISHGGTGSLIQALKMGKQVVAVPRLVKYGEAIDDHQVQIIDVLEEAGYIKKVMNIEGLLGAIEDIKRNPITKRYQASSDMLMIINEFLEKHFAKQGSRQTPRQSRG